MKVNCGKAGLKALKKSALTDKNEQVRLVSFQSIVEIQGAEDVATIKKVIMTDPSSYTRMLSVDALGRAKNISREKKIDLLNEALENETETKVIKIITGHKNALEKGKAFNFIIDIRK